MDWRDLHQPKANRSIDVRVGGNLIEDNLIQQEKVRLSISVTPSGTSKLTVSDSGNDDDGWREDESDEEDNAEEEEEAEMTVDEQIEEWIADNPLVEFEGVRYDRRTVRKIDVPEGVTEIEESAVTASINLSSIK